MRNRSKLKISIFAFIFLAAILILLCSSCDFQKDGHIYDGGEVIIQATCETDGANKILLRKMRNIQR